MISSHPRWTVATWYLLAYPSLWLTTYNGCWILQHAHASSVAHTSAIIVWHSFYMPTCTGSVWQTGSGTSLLWQSTSVCTTEHNGPWQIAALQSQTSPHTIISWIYLVANAAHLVVRHSLSPDPPCGTHCQTSSEIQAVLTKLFDDYWIYFCSCCINVLSALEVYTITVCERYKFAFSQHALWKR